ncbi:MAG: hypothetical protein K2M20_01030 [Lachnospiraceae bacterium]|nr:hypothetical protein [Lachnospiraceae bacterium]
MKKFLALSFALALTFSTTVCAAETIVPAKDFSKIDTLSDCAVKALPEYTSNAVSEMDGVRDLPAIASASNLVTEGAETNATCVVDKVDVAAIRYAQQKAAEVGGTMLAVAELSAPGVNLIDAQVALTVEGVAAGDAVSVFKCVKGEWTAVDVVAVAENTVTIKFDSKGIYTVIK